MPDMKEIYEMVIKQAPPTRDPLREQLARQARLARSRKLTAIVASAALFVALATAGVLALSHSGDDAVPADRGGQSPLVGSPPLGPQVVALNGTVVRDIAGDLAPGIDVDASVRVSPDGGTIAFYGLDGITSIGVDGTGQRVLVPGVPDRGGDAKHNLSWSPDGSKIAYSWHEDVWVMNADGSDRQRLTHSRGGSGSYFPAWSPDGSTIAYWHGSSDGRDGGPPDAEIYTIPAVGGEPTRLTHDDASSIEPAWSPDGTQIVYREAEPAGLVVMNADGSDPRVVTREGANPWAPTWSPDGARIAYLECCADHRAASYRPLLTVEVLDVASGTITRLDVDVETDLNGPTWASNETLLVNRYE
jgi:Tol biopolymer transport system component